MIHHNDYNCRERGECYLTYRKRIIEERRIEKQRRALKQTNEEWINEYTATMDRINKAGGLGAYVRYRT